MPAEKAPHGTINILLFINVDLTPGALTRSLVTCTEAKTAALQELVAPSRYSNGLATGSGTDGTIIVCNPGSSIQLDNAGKHCKLGELIGRAVKAAVKDALYLQTGLSPENQRNVLRRVDRFGITAQSLWDALGGEKPAGRGKARFWQQLETDLCKEEVVAAVSLYVHLMDQINWGLLSPAAAFRAAEPLLDAVCASAPAAEAEPEEAAAAVEYMTRRLQACLAARLRQGGQV